MIKNINSKQRCNIEDSCILLIFNLQYSMFNGYGGSDDESNFKRNN